MSYQPAFEEFLGALGANPDIIPHQVDLIQDRVLLINIPITEQSKAVFLDQRALTPHTKGGWCSWDQLRAAASATRPGRLSYILHVGHCGSTLISRLVEAVGAGRALREPLPLRTIAIDAADAHDGASLLTDDERTARLRVLERLWARPPGAVVKATSMCNGLIDALEPDAQIVFAFVKPAIYLALLLGGANTMTDLRNFAQMRYRRLAALVGGLKPLPELKPGELAAMSWLAETASIAGSNRDVLDVDFDGFLASPEKGLATICNNLGRNPNAAAIRSAVSGPIMSRYSKAQEHAFTAETRAQIIAEDSAIHGEAIRIGMKWLERTSARFAAGKAAMGRFAA